jgi:hypothetical protein
MPVLWRDETMGIVCVEDYEGVSTGRVVELIRIGDGIAHVMEIKF